MNEEEKRIKIKINDLKDKKVSNDDLKTIDKEISKLLRDGYMPLYLSKTTNFDNQDKLQEELESKFDELFSDGDETDKRLKEMDIICEFMNLCKNNDYEFYKSKTFINFLKLSPINFYRYVKEYEIKENLKKYLKYINEKYLIVNADSIFGLINAMRLDRLLYAKEISDLFDEYVEEYDELKIEAYMKRKKELNKEEFWDFASELNKCKISTGLLPKDACRYIICESLNPKSQLSLDFDFWAGLKDCAFCDYLTYEEIEKCDEGYCLNYTLTLNNAKGVYDNSAINICLDPYYIYKFSADDMSALTTMFHELEHLKQNIAIDSEEYSNLHYDMVKEKLLIRYGDDAIENQELNFFSEMEARRLGYENAVDFLKQNKVNINKIKSRAIRSDKKLSLDEFRKISDEDYQKCFFNKTYGRKRFNTNRRLEEIFRKNIELLKNRTILYYEFTEDGERKTLEAVLKRLDEDLKNGVISKENAKAILKSTLFDSVRVMGKTYAKRIEEVLSFEYSNKESEQVCNEALREKMQEIIYVLKCTKKLKNKVEICRLLKTYLNN